MKTMKDYTLLKFKTICMAGVPIILSLLLLMVRVKLNKSFFYLFLVWNIFLAVIPYAIAIHLDTKQQISKLKLVIGFEIWLLFLPNAPYIITDFIHLRTANNTYLWLDILLLLAFALSGLILCYTSLSIMLKLIAKHFKNIPLNLLSQLIFFSCGFGVYLGRFLRYNSWEIISQPKHLISDIIHIIVAPQHYYEAWLFTTVFGLCLSVGYWIFKSLNHNQL